MSDSGEQALLVTSKLDLYVWELRDGQHSDWWKLPIPDDIDLPHTNNRTTITDANFYVHQVCGVCIHYCITCMCWFSTNIMFEYIIYCT